MAKYKQPKTRIEVIERADNTVQYWPRVKGLFFYSQYLAVAEKINGEVTDVEIDTFEGYLAFRSGSLSEVIKVIDVFLVSDRRRWLDEQNKKILNKHVIKYP